MKYYVGQRVRVGGCKGPIETISEIHGDMLTLVSDHSVGYLSIGDCPIVPVKEYEQLSLFGD